MWHGAANCDLRKHVPLPLVFRGPNVSGLVGAVLDPVDGRAETGRGVLTEALSVVRRRVRELLSRPTPPRPKSITTTAALPFRIRRCIEGTVEVQITI